MYNLCMKCHRNVSLYWNCIPNKNNNSGHLKFWVIFPWQNIHGIEITPELKGINSWNLIFEFLLLGQYFINKKKQLSLFLNYLPLAKFYAWAITSDPFGIYSWIFSRACTFMRTFGKQEISCHWNHVQFIEMLMVGASIHLGHIF